MRRLASILLAVSAAALVLQPVSHATLAYATFPGTSGLIAFSDVRHPFRLSFVEEVRPDGTFVRTVASGFEVYWDAAWSPNGTMLAFNATARGEGKVPHIAVARPNGTHLHSITGRRTHSPAWSPSGGRIVYTQGQGSHSSNLVIKNLVTGKETQLTHSPQRFANGDPDWSPDGTRIVFSGSVGDNRRLYVMTLSGRHLTRVTTDSLAPSSPSWSPDGTKVLFAGSDGYLHVLTMSTRHPGSLVAGHQGVWSPDGTEVAYTKSNYPAEGYDLFVLPLGGSPIAIYSSVEDLFDHSWQTTASLKG